jgi:uncharacterized protein (DUF736 family)
MATIGTLTKQKDGSHKGYISTLTIYKQITLRMIENEKLTERGPIARIFAGAGEVGAAFEQTAQESGQVFLSLKLDDPTFAAPIYCAAFPNKEKPDDLDLVWSRPKQS